MLQEPREFIAGFHFGVQSPISATATTINYYYDYYYINKHLFSYVLDTILSVRELLLESSTIFFSCTRSRKQKVQQNLPGRFQLEYL